MSHFPSFRLKWIEITSLGRSDFKFTHAVDTNPEAQKLNLVWNCIFNEKTTRRLQQILKFPGEYNTNTSCSYSSLKSWIWLKNAQGILHPCRCTELSFDLDSEAYTHCFAPEQTCCTPMSQEELNCTLFVQIPKTGLSQRFGFLTSTASTSTSYPSGLRFVPTFRLRCSGTSKKFRKIRLLAPLFCAVRFCQFFNKQCTNRYETW